jgi:hypothetical protein
LKRGDDRCSAAADVCVKMTAVNLSSDAFDGGTGRVGVWAVGVNLESI